MQLEEAAVTVDGACAGDDAEASLGEPGHGHVADDAAALVEQLRVDDRADGPVDAVAAHTLEQRERAGTGDLELAEGRQVDDPDPLAHGRVLDGDAVVGRRAAPPERALLLACAAPGLARAEVVGALPAVLRQPNTAPSSWSRPCSGLRRRGRPASETSHGVALPVVVLVDLARARGSEVGIAIGAAEAPRPVGLHVDLGRAGRHELGERLPEPAGASEAVQRETRCEPEATHARHRAEQRVPVGRHRVRMTDERGHTGVVEEREPPRRSLHQLLEPRVVGREHA